MCDTWLSWYVRLYFIITPWLFRPTSRTRDSLCRKKLRETQAQALHAIFSKYYHYYHSILRITTIWRTQNFEFSSEGCTFFFFYQYFAQCSRQHFHYFLCGRRISYVVTRALTYYSYHVFTSLRNSGVISRDVFARFGERDFKCERSAQKRRARARKKKKTNENRLETAPVAWRTHSWHAGDASLRDARRARLRSSWLVSARLHGFLATAAARSDRQGKKSTRRLRCCSDNNLTAAAWRGWSAKAEPFVTHFTIRPASVRSARYRTISAKRKEHVMRCRARCSRCPTRLCVNE